MRPWILAETNYGYTRDHRYEVAVLPLGATEPHNLHLPYSMDSLEGSAIATEGPWDDPVPMRMRRLPPDTSVEAGIPGFVRGGRQAEGVDPFGQQGAGRVVYFPVGFDHAYYSYSYPYQRRLLSGAMRWAKTLPSSTPH